MMYKMLISVIIMIMMLTFGCGVKEKTQNEEVEPKQEEVVEAEQTEPEEPPEVEENQNEEIDFQSMIPDPTEYFLNTEFEAVTEPDGYTVWLDYVKEEEWNAYIDKCKELGIWTKESYRSDYAWYVDSDDGKFELMLDRYGDKNVYMTIIINVKEEDE